MATSLGGINTALTSLHAQRRAMDVTGQNIAEVNTEGYTRRVDTTAQAGSIVPTMWSKSDGVGTGVAVTDVQRLRDEFLEAMRLRGDTGVNEQYSRNAGDGQGWLDQLDCALGDATTQVTAARNLTLQGLRGGTSSPASREALAVEIDDIKDSLIAIANTKYLDRSVFGGTSTAAAAYSASGTYTGDAGQVTRTVGANVKVRVDVNGPDAFGAGGTQLFTVLQGISASLRSNDPVALNDGLMNLDSARDLLTSKVSDVGSRANRLSQMQTSAESRLVSLKGQLSDVEDIDLPKTIMEVKLQETFYQAALAAGAKVIQPSLMDYLR